MCDRNLHADASQNLTDPSACLLFSKDREEKQSWIEGSLSSLAQLLNFKGILAPAESVGSHTQWW